MDRDGVMALLVSVLGAVCVALLALGPVFYVYKHGFGRIQPGSVDGAEAWKEKSTQEAEEQRERQEKIRAAGLDTRYTIHPLFGDTRTLLYEQRDFAAVDARLAEQFAKCADPYQAHLYSRMVANITLLKYDDDPERMLAAFNDWVAADPSSYRARMLRGTMHIRYGWYFRGTGFMNSVSSSSLSGFEDELRLAREDLQAAWAMNANDPEIPINLGTICKAIGDDRAATERCYQDAIALQPLSLSARVGKVEAALPKWGGSWQEVDAVLAECETMSDQFPLLGIVQRVAKMQMSNRSAAHKAALERDSRYLNWAKPYVAQLERNPGDPMLMTHAAYYLSRGDDFAQAESFYRALGDNFYELGSDSFQDVLHYNNLRGYVYAAVANTKIGTPEGRPRAEEALAIAPNHYYTNHVYGTLLFVEEDYSGSAPYFQKAAELHPKYLWSSIRLAEVADKLGQKAEATERAKKLLKSELSADQRKRLQAVIGRNS